MIFFYLTTYTIYIKNNFEKNYQIKNFKYPIFMALFK